MDHQKEDIVRHAVYSDPAYFNRVKSCTAENGTSADKQDMLRMGKRQETQRNFRHITILAFVTVILAIWENILSPTVFVLGDGGTAGLIWGYLLVMIGFGFVTASLAEMASM
jgi:choline transport protein